MNPLFSGLIVFIIVFGAALLAMFLRTRLPEHHLNQETIDTVKMAMGIVAMLTAMVLGLLIASAKGTNDDERKALTTMVAKLIIVDRLLSLYGPEAAIAQEKLRLSAITMKERLWAENSQHIAQMDPHHTLAESVFKAIANLSPHTDEQKIIKARVLEEVYDLDEMRWLVFQQAAPSIKGILLFIVVCWLSILFISFGLFAPPNGTAIAALLLAALSIAGAVFLLLELDSPFGGLLQISSEPMLNTLKQLGH